MHFEQEMGNVSAEKKEVPEFRVLDRRESEDGTVTFEVEWKGDRFEVSHVGFESSVTDGRHGYSGIKKNETGENDELPTHDAETLFHRAMDRGQ